MSDTGEVVRQHFDAFNRRDAAADPWADDAEMIAPGAVLHGRDEVLGFLSVFQTAFPDGTLKVKKLLVDGASAGAEGVFTGTHDGVLHTPSGDVPATGRPVEFRWAAVYEVTGSELRSEHLYFDQLDFLSKLGLVGE